MKPITIAALLSTVLGVSVFLHLVQYGQVCALESRLERFEKTATRAFASHLSALEKTLSHQQVLARMFMQSKELRLTFEQLENYNAKTRPRNYTAAQGECNGETTKLLRSKAVRNRAPVGTGAWTEAFPVQEAAARRKD